MDLFCRKEEKRELFLRMLELLVEQKLLREEEQNRLRIRLMEYPVSNRL